MNINTYGDNKYSIDTPNQKDTGLNITDVETKVKTNDETVVYSLEYICEDWFCHSL